MYDDLVKRLRAAAIMSDALSAFLPHSEGGAIAKLYNEAADAIENMSEAYNKLSRQMDDLAALMPRWIPVTERLPKVSGHYLIRIECKCDGELFSAWMQVAWFCEKFYWVHLQSDGVFKETVTHWMPLPQPPKEG